jgi:hypothetical protein
MLSEALDFISGRFGSPSWIDHGYNNHLENNREDFVCDGTLDDSPYFTADLWNSNGVKYFWNPFYEDMRTFENWQFSNYIDKPFHGFGDFIPDPDYWLHPTRSGLLVHWPTKSVFYVENNSLWDYYFSQKVLNALVESWEVEINHCYPAWVDPSKGFWNYNSDGMIVAQPGFNHVLERMAGLRDAGRLNVTTIHDFMDYQLAVEKVNYRLLPDGRIKVTNLSDEAIEGLAFATSARFVLVNGNRPHQKVVDGNLIFWFNLSADEYKIIRMVY